MTVVTLPRFPNPAQFERMATIAIVRRASTRRPIAPEHRVTRCKAKGFRVHAKHASPSTMTMKEKAVAEIKAAWQQYRTTEKYGLEFGKVCCEWRDKFGQKRTGPLTKGTGLAQILSQLNPPCKEGKAYYWMNQFEISTGAKTARPEKQKPEAPSPWIPDNEKRANRSDPIAGMKGYKILAKKMLEAGFCELLKKKAADQSHLWAAKDWAKLRLDLGDALED